MIKGDKIVDVRNNSVHTVECIDVYDTVTLVFTEDKKYIPFNDVREFTIKDILLDKDFINIVKEYKKEKLKEKFLKILNSDLDFT